MKKNKLLTLSLVLLCSYTFGQSSAVQIQSPDSTVIKYLVKELSELKNRTDRNSSNIDVILASKVLDSKNQYTILKTNITQGIFTYELLHEKVKLFIEKISSDKLNAFINDLNNPQSNKLGFKLDAEIIKIVNSRIAPKEKNVAKKIIENVSAISTSPLINSIPAIAPALSITNSVIGLLRSTSIMKDKVDQNAINDFEADLSKFTKYYEVLNEANTGLTFNIKNRDQSLSILQQKIADEVSYQAKTLGIVIPTKGPNEDLSNYLNTVFSIFNKSILENKIVDIEKANTQNGIPNYAAILAINNGSLKDANNHLDELSNLINTLEIYHDEYFNISSFYYTKIVEALNVAKASGVANAAIVDAQLTEFKTLTANSTTAFRASVNLAALLTAKQSIKFSAKIL